MSWLDTETGEGGEQKLVHAAGEAQPFYEKLAAPGLIGMEATGNNQESSSRRPSPASLAATLPEHACDITWVI